jgi:hypothetical protein
MEVGTWLVSTIDDHTTGKVVAVDGNTVTVQMSGGRLDMCHGGEFTDSWRTA